MERNDSPQPGRPTHIPVYAEVCLRALVTAGLNHKISLGGAFGLLHHLDYSATHDVDAWWDASATTQDHEQVIQVIEIALTPHGRVQKRAWGDVVSIELVQANQVVFSFQIAQRSAQLQPTISAVWVDEDFLDALVD
jgi:hypothetical protein